MKKIFLILISICTIKFACAQSAEKTKRQIRQERIISLMQKEEEGQIIFDKQLTYGAQFNTDGYGAFFEIMKFKTPVKSYWGRVEIGEHKNLKEERGTNLAIPGSGSFVFGKINNFYYLKLGVGQQLMIAGKGSKNGVALSALYGGGIGAGFLKPYVLEAIDPATGNPEFITYDQPGKSTIYTMRPDLVTKSGGFFRGWNGVKLSPSLHAKAALRFDYGRYNQVVSALEVGTNWEYYTKSMTTMAEVKGAQSFFNIYASIIFGSRK